jgi:hypothetical protein
MLLLLLKVMVEVVVVVLMLHWRCQQQQLARRSPTAATTCLEVQSKVTAERTATQIGLSPYGCHTRTCHEVEWGQVVHERAHATHAACTLQVMNQPGD